MQPWWARRSPNWIYTASDDRGIGSKRIKCLENFLEPGPARDRIIVHERDEFGPALRRGHIAGIRQPGNFLDNVGQIGYRREALADCMCARVIGRVVHDQDAVKGGAKGLLCGAFDRLRKDIIPIIRADRDRYSGRRGLHLRRRNLAGVVRFDSTGNSTGGLRFSWCSDETFGTASMRSHRNTSPSARISSDLPSADGTDTPGHTNDIIVPPTRSRGGITPRTSNSPSTSTSAVAISCPST